MKRCNRCSMEMHDSFTSCPGCGSDDIETVQEKEKTGPKPGNKKKNKKKAPKKKRC